MRISKNNIGLTMIELLVVFAVIGLLSSIVLIAVKESREKAKIAGSLQFSGNIKNALGAYIVGEWKFEESGDDTCSGGDPMYNDFCDTSGNENHGQNSWIPVIRVENDEINDIGQAGKFFNDGNPWGFNGTSVIISTANFSKYSSGSITIEAWIKPDYFSDVFDIIVVNSNGDFRLSIDNGHLCFLSGAGSPVCGGSTISVGEWHHIVGSHHQNIGQKVFVDAKEVAHGPAGFAFDPSHLETVLIGSRYGQQAFNGLIDEVRIYEEGVNLSQVQRLYADGLKRHLGNK